MHKFIIQSKSFEYNLSASQSQLMGQNSLANNSQLGFDPNQWIEALEDKQTTRFPNVNPYRKRLLMNKMTSELVEEYQIQFFSYSDYNGFISEVEIRKDNKSSQKLSISHNHNDDIRNCPYIYKVRHFRALQVQEMCTTIYNGLLYIDKVDVRLKQVNDIPFQDQLYLYKACLLGFKTLYENAGVFEITQQMIFFDQNGNVKVWINPNLSKFQPNYEPQYYNNVNYIESQGSQSEMIRNLINIIENNTDKQSTERYGSFRDNLKQKCLIDRLSFVKTLEYFENYLAEQNFTPNKYMHSIYELYHYSEKKEKGSRESSQVDVVHFKRERTNEGTSFSNFGQKLQANRQQKSQINRYTPLEKSIASRVESENEFLTFRNRSKVIPIPPNLKNVSNDYCENDPFSYYGIRERPNNSKMMFQRQTSYKVQKENPSIQRRTESNVRSVLTFNPQQLKQRANYSRVNYQISPAPSSNWQTLERYRSLDRVNNFSFGGSGKNITFSYQKQGPGVLKAYKANKSEQKKPIGTINPGTSKPKDSIIDRLIMVNTINTIKSIESSSSIKDGAKAEGPPTNNVKLNYFTTNCEYLLDQEIAEDMIKYLSFNPNS